MKGWVPVALLAVITLSCRANEPRANAEFDGTAALGYARTVLDFGPRVPATPEARRTGDWIIAQMRSRADTVVTQEWSYTTSDGRVLPLRNILARYKPAATSRILYVTHWDSRPVADDDPDPALRTQPLLGANDGASGVGLFLALGDALSRHPPAIGVDLLFDDGEDWGSFDPDVDVLLGSIYFAAHLPDPGYQPQFGVLWDMIGDRDLQMFREQNSVARAPDVVERVWSTARRLGYERYFAPDPGYDIIDDHIPLLDAGLPVIDVIDLDYPYHHTTADTFDKISSQSLGVVGDVALTLIRDASP